MTDERKLRDKKGALSKLVGFCAVFLLISPAFLFPKEISEGVLRGIKLCASNVIPSVFPFLVIADAVLALSDSFGSGALGKIFSRIFHLPKEGVGAFISGSVCGFPVGVRVSSELYERGLLRKEEAEHLIGFSNNPSAAFVITAVGLGMFGSVKIGVTLYLTVIISAVISGFIFRGEAKSKSNKTVINTRQKFDFVSSVKNAGFSSLTVCSYVIFFSAVSGLVLNICGEGLIGLAALFLSEISGGALFISSMPFFGLKTALILTSAALAFSGFSVHLQSRALACKKISFIKYYIMKSTQCIIAGAIAFPTFNYLPI